MPDENNTGSTAEAPVTDIPTTPTPKKQRAKRHPKTEALSASPATAVKATRAYRKKTAEQTGEKTVPVVAAAATGKRSKKDGVTSIAKAKTPAKAAVAVSIAGAEMADLLQLEEENKSLRNALSEKLRAENADLRKRLALK